MMLGLGFLTPWLLVGLAAAAIPFLLHLLASVRAPEVPFPTLRFLRRSMEKTARRRRIQHWLLLLMRAAALALLATAAAEPFTRGAGGWQKGQRHAAVVILDNSLSMNVRRQDGTALEMAKRQADALLAGDDGPSLAAVAATNGQKADWQLSADLETLRKGVQAVTASAGRAAPAGLVEQAAGALAGSDCPKKSIYLLGDLQKLSFEELAGARGLGQGQGVHLLVLDVAKRPVANAGVTELTISGDRMVNQPVQFKATVTNSSAKPRQVRLVLRADGQEGEAVTKELAAAGEPGSSQPVWFSRPFGRPGPVTGEVAILGEDDLPEDNVRRFHFVVGQPARALVVGGPAEANDSPKLSPTWCLEASLSPWGESERPWPIQYRRIGAAALQARDLGWPDIVFLSNVPSLTDEQVKGLERFVRQGGTAAVALGPDVNVAAYNRGLGAAGLLPGELAEAVGQVGADADAMGVTQIDGEHPYLAGFYGSPSEFPRVLVWRHFPLRQMRTDARRLMSLPGRRAIVTVHPLGAGRVLFCTTTASPKWSDLAVRLGPPLWIRATLSAPRAARAPEMYSPGEAVLIRPGGGGAEEARVVVRLPGEKPGEPSATESAPLRTTEQGPVAEFRNTGRPGVYSWRVEPAEAVRGEFVVNPVGPESRLASYSGQEFLAMMRGKGFDRVYVGTSLEELHRSAQADAQPVAWWDRVAAAVILLLVGEALVANLRRQRGDEPVAAA